MKKKKNDFKRFSELLFVFTHTVDRANNQNTLHGRWTNGYFRRSIDNSITAFFYANETHTDAVLKRKKHFDFKRNAFFIPSNRPLNRDRAR